MFAIIIASQDTSTLFNTHSRSRRLAQTVKLSLWHLGFQVSRRTSFELPGKTLVGLLGPY